MAVILFYILYARLYQGGAVFQPSELSYSTLDWIALFFPSHWLVGQNGSSPCIWVLRIDLQLSMCSILIAALLFIGRYLSKKPYCKLIVRLKAATTWNNQNKKPMKPRTSANEMELHWKRGDKWDYWSGLSNTWSADCRLRSLCTC